MAYTADTLLIEPGTGEEVESGMRVKVRAAQLGNDFSIMEGEVDPNQLLAPHTHTREDQVVFVIEGTLEFEVGGEGGERFTAPQGSYVIKPRGLSHAFWNKGDKTVRYIELSGRTGFEQFVDSTRQGAIKASMTSKADYGITFHRTRIPTLLRRHGLTSVRGITMPWEG